jgi:hypothetical protein
MILGMIGKRTKRVTTTMLARLCLVPNTRSCSSAECLTRFESHAQWATPTWTLVQRNSKPTSQDSTAPERLQRAHNLSHMRRILQTWMTPRACSASTPRIIPAIQAQASQSRRSREPPYSAQSRRKRRPVTANEAFPVLVKPRQVLSYQGRTGSQFTHLSTHTREAWLAILLHHNLVPAQHLGVVKCIRLLHVQLVETQQGTSQVHSLQRLRHLIGRHLLHRKGDRLSHGSMPKNHLSLVRARPL